MPDVPRDGEADDLTWLVMFVSEALLESLPATNMFLVLNLSSHVALIDLAWLVSLPPGVFLEKCLACSRISSSLGLNPA